MKKVVVVLIVVVAMLIAGWFFVGRWWFLRWNAEKEVNALLERAAGVALLWGEPGEAEMKKVLETGVSAPVGAAGWLALKGDSRFRRLRSAFAMMDVLEMNPRRDASGVRSAGRILAAVDDSGSILLDVERRAGEFLIRAGESTMAARVPALSEAVRDVLEQVMVQCLSAAVDAGRLRNWCETAWREKVRPEKLFRGGFRRVAYSAVRRSRQDGDAEATAGVDELVALLVRDGSRHSLALALAWLAERGAGSAVTPVLRAPTMRVGNLTAPEGVSTAALRVWAESAYEWLMANWGRVRWSGAQECWSAGEKDDGEAAPRVLQEAKDVDAVLEGILR